MKYWIRVTRRQKDNETDKYNAKYKHNAMCVNYAGVPFAFNMKNTARIANAVPVTLYSKVTK